MIKKKFVKTIMPDIEEPHIITQQLDKFIHSYRVNEEMFHHVPEDYKSIFRHEMDKIIDQQTYSYDYHNDRYRRQQNHAYTIAYISKQHEFVEKKKTKEGMTTKNAEMEFAKTFSDKPKKILNIDYNLLGSEMEPDEPEE